MEFTALIKARRMHRHFTPRPLPPATVTRIAQAALRAPSAGFTQGTRLLVIDQRAALETFWDTIATPEWLAEPAREGLANAPCIMVPFQNRDAYLERYGQQDKAYAAFSSPADFPAPYWTIDAAFAAMLVQLAAINEGLGCLYFGLPKPDQAFRAAFLVPEALEPIGAIAIGEPSRSEPTGSSTRRARLPQELVVIRNSF